MRRHYLYANQEDETSVGDGSAKSSVLRQWLARRRQLLHGDTAVARLAVLFWTLAKPASAVALAKSEYVAFFQRVAKALVQSVGTDHAAIVAARDWLYDCAGATDEDALAMSLGQFQEALLQCADLVLPVESDASTFASFFRELRDAIATPTDALRALRALRDVPKIRGAFLQKTPPNADHLALVRGLPTPDVDAMSLKQLLLSYNPRKFSLSRAFSSLFTPPPAVAPVSPLVELVESPCVASRASSTPLAPSALLSRASDDAFDPEQALVGAIESFPALRIAVVGPPGAGKTRLARSLARRLELQYVSAVDAIERARDERARQRAQVRVAAKAADTKTEPGEEAAAAETPPIDADEESEPPDDAELLFGDADLAALERGAALAAGRALPLLVAFARELLLRGVGVVLEDVFPAEVADALAIDYVVSLEMAREDARDHVAGFTLAPASQRVYSARERAMLRECDAELRENGFADGATFEPSPQDASSDDTERLSRRARVAEAIAAEASAPAQRNKIAPLGEPTVPLRRLLLDAFDAKYRGFHARAASLAPTKRTQVVPVDAAQALHDVLDQCVVAITNNSQGLGRSAWSRSPLRVSPPEVIAASGSRADRLRWLLYGDWTDWLASLDDGSFSHGPADPRQPRQLSRWRDCCVVSSSAASTPILGDPQYAAYFSGRVYLFASDHACDSFCAAPLQFLRRPPAAVPSTRKLWVLASGPLPHSTGQALAGVVEGDHVSATQVLSAHHSIQQIMELAEGRALAAGAVAPVVADALVDKSAWVLTDLVPTKETVSILHERGCLPDAIVLLTVDERDVPRLFRTPLELKKQKLWIAQHPPDGTSPLDDLLAEAQLAIPRLRCRLSTDASDCDAAFRRVLSPLAPRVDTVDDGTRNESEEEHARVFGPAEQPENGQEDAPADGDDDVEKREAEALGYSKKQRAFLAKRNRMGETAQFCAVTWKQTRRLVPGLPEFVASFCQKLYAFAGREELSAFERNPLEYLPATSTATRGFVPVVWMLGVRGSELEVLAQGLVQSEKSTRVGVVDNAAIVARVERRLRAQLLQPLDKQTPLPTMYLDELGHETRRMVESNLWDVVVVTNISTTGITVPPQLGEESAEAVDTPSALPTLEMLTLCFQSCLFPNLVVTVEASEDVTTKRLLMRWREAQLPTRPRRKSAAAGGDVADDGEPESVDPGELEASEAARLQEQFETDREALPLALGAIHARGLAVETVRGDGSRRAVIKSVADIVRDLLSRNDSQFEFCERVSLSHARSLLRSGEAIVGKHAMLCPISGQPPSGSPSRPALLYRGRLYFPDSTSNTLTCELAPASTMAEPASQPPRTVGTCCIVGPPSVGKTRLARDLATSMGLAYVSPQSAVEWVLQCLGPQSVLWSRIKMARSDGSRPLDVGLVHEAIYTRLCSSECQRQGWVLDGYMLTSSELDLCLDSTKHPIHPAVVFCLEGLISQSQRGTPSEPLEDHHESLVDAFGAWRQHRLDLLRTWTSTFGSFHIREINTEKDSAWQVHAQARDVLELHVASTRRYFQDTIMARPTRLHRIVRAGGLLAAQAHSVYQSFCPVELAAGRYHSSLPENRELCVEVIDERDTPVVLWLASHHHLHTFCSSPREFLDLQNVERARELIRKAPVDASLLSLLSVPDCEFPEMKGYCPVTFQQGTGDKDWQAIVKGSVFYRVSYENKVFFCISERKRRAFIAEPTKYASQVLPIKLPPQISRPLAFKNCPGRIEQELSGVLNETLMQLGATRPKFLGVSTSSSACFYLALLLKTRATKALPDHIRARYVDQLRNFERDCRIGEQLKAHISPSGTTSCGPGIKGARAVRKLSANSSETDLPLLDKVTDGDSTLVDSVLLRFDELAGSSHHVGNLNQEQGAPRPNDQFLEYAKSLIPAKHAP